MKRLKYNWKYIKISYIINFKSMQAYGGDFIFGVIAEIINSLASLAVVLFIYQLVPKIAGWSLDEILLLYGLSTIGNGVWACFCVNTISLPYYLQDGSFDRFLVRPISPIFQIMMDGFEDDGVGELILGIGILAYAWIHIGISPIRLIGVPIFAVSAALIYAGISILLSTVSFYTISGNIANIAMDLEAFTKYPLTVYSKGLRVLFSTALPIAMIAYYPSFYFLKKDWSSWFLLLLIPGLSYVFFMLCKLVWTKLGLCKYSSTGT